MSYSNSFKNIINTILFFTGIPSLASFISGKFGYNEINVFFVTLLIVWTASIEVRLKDLKKKNRRRK